MSLLPLNLVTVEQSLPGKVAAKPNSRTLSGHAAGQAFEDVTYDLVKSLFPSSTWRQYEFLNQLYAANPKALSFEERSELIPLESVRVLVSRGKAAVTGWTATAPFLEKQNDTADILVVKNGDFHVIDVKTCNAAKQGQPPNIISSLKLAHMCAAMIDGNEYEQLDIVYVGIDWKEQGDQLVCSKSAIRRLFRATPANLYVNWAAALQIQFHVSGLDQTYAASVEEWTHDYLKMFVSSAQHRVDKMRLNYIDRFKKYL